MQAPLDSPTPSPQRPRRSFVFEMTGIIICAAFGLLIGVVLQQNNASDTAITWVGTIGSLFLRAVWCLVGPLVLCSLVESLLDLFEDGRAALVSKFALLLYVLTTVAATTEGLLLALLFKPFFSKPDLVETDAANRVAMQLGCGGYDSNMMVHHFTNGSLGCASVSNDSSLTYMSSASAAPWTFWAVDVNGSFELSSDTSSSTHITSSTVSQSITDTIQAQLESLVPESIAAAFVNGDLLSIVTFSALFTVALAAPGQRRLEVLSKVIRCLNAVFMRMITWIVRYWTPFAIMSLLAKAIGGSTDMSTLFRNVGLYIVCELTAMAIHMYGFYPVILWTLGKTRNPYAWLGKMFRAQLFAFGCASSMATLPVVMSCVEKTRIMPVTLSRFLLSIGATVGKDGAAATYPIAILFMAVANGTDLTAVQIVSIGLLAALGSIATGPVPAAGMIMVAAIWKSVTSTDPPVELFNLIVSANWLMDRFGTVVNVTCDTIVCRVIASHVCPEFEESNGGLPPFHSLESTRRDDDLELGTFGFENRSSSKRDRGSLVAEGNSPRHSRGGNDMLLSL